ncbi:MAG: hypothetical protein AVDCRST_MAG48-1882, partial [uncultured Friedmanniella sp.]
GSTGGARQRTGGLPRARSQRASARRGRLDRRYLHRRQLHRCHLHGPRDDPADGDTATGGRPRRAGRGIDAGGAHRYDRDPRRLIHRHAALAAAAGRAGRRHDRDRRPAGHRVAGRAPPAGARRRGGPH